MSWIHAEVTYQLSTLGMCPPCGASKGVNEQISAHGVLNEHIVSRDGSYLQGI